MMKTRDLINIIMGGLLVVGIKTIFHPCNSMEKVMRCTYTSRIVMLLGIFLILKSIINIARKCYEEKNDFLLSVFIYIYAIGVPFMVIGGCDNMDMRCRAVTFPAIYLISLIGIISNIISLVMDKKASK